MSRRLFVLALVSSVLVAAMVGAPASALTHDKLTYLTFSGPVQVPGATLDPGTYRFHLTNPTSSRDVIQVLSNDGSTVYAMFLTLPDRRGFATREPAVTFMEVPVGVIPPVKSLFYPGELRGYEFIYPHGGPDMTAHLLTQPDVTYAPTPGVAAIAPTPILEALPAAPAYAPFATVEPATTLPATGSELPLATLAGLASLALAYGAHALRRKL